MQGKMVLMIWDVEHGQCAMLTHNQDGRDGRLAMIDSGCSSTWQPSDYIRNHLGRTQLDYLFITNADQDHMSDLAGLADKGVRVFVAFLNRSYTGEQLRAIKRRGGELTRDAERYASMCETYNSPVSYPFNDSMGGITCKTFFNKYPTFSDTNNLSLVVFITYAGFTILFPGDVERAGWLELLKNPEFRSYLSKVDILVASHHGRENGFCSEVFDYCHPQAVVISDKSIVHSTQETVPDYRNVVIGGVYVKNTGKLRHVLTTRRDGWIKFTVADEGFDVETEYGG